MSHLTKRVVDLDGVESSEELHFFYDAQSRPAFVECEGTVYRYIHNLQGDIVAIVDFTGNPMVEYRYDVWGTCNSSVSATGIVVNNPFRYRAYVWDEESELYYLKNRYYDANMCRFISPDMVAAKTSDMISSVRNLYTYCYNEANNHVDDEGTLGFLATLALGGLVNAASSALCSFLRGEKIEIKDVVIDFGMGMVTTFAGMMGGICGRVVSGIASAAVEGVDYIFDEDNGGYTTRECLTRMGCSFISAAFAPQLETSYVDELMGVERYTDQWLDLAYSTTDSLLGGYYEDKRKKDWKYGSEYIKKVVYDPMKGANREIYVFV